MRTYILIPLFVFIAIAVEAQQYLDYQLRLEPVWSRVADVLGEKGSVESAEFSPDGKFIVSGTKYDNSVVMWRTSDGTELWRQYTALEVERVGWSYDNKWVAAASEDFLVTVYDAESGEPIKEIKHTEGIDGLTWANGRLLLASGEEKSIDSDGEQHGWIRIFDMPSATEIATIDYGSTVNEMFFSSDDRYLLAIGHIGVKIYDTSDWTLAQELYAPDAQILTSGVFSPDDKYVIVTGRTSTTRGIIYLWDWREAKLLKAFNHLGKKVESVTWHPNGDYILYAGHDGNIFTYRVADILQYSNDRIPTASRTWASDHMEYLDFNADGSFLVSAHQNGLIKLWVWMGEDSALNEKLHHGIKQQQDAAQAAIVR